MNTLELPTRPDWHRFGTCVVEKVHPSVFYPERGKSVEGAYEICRRCPVRKQCLESALANHERFGIWGGETERRRRRFNRRGQVAS